MTTMANSRSSLRRLAVVAICLEILLAIGAIGGGIALMAGPNGEVLPLPISALKGSPFRNYLAPGAILFTIRGPRRFGRPTRFLETLELRAADLCGARLSLRRLLFPSWPVSCNRVVSETSGS